MVCYITLHRVQFSMYSLFPPTRSEGQVFVSTHSPDFLNAVDLSNIFWLEKQEGITKVYRASEQELLNNLCQQGDLPGYLWKQGIFGGFDPK